MHVALFHGSERTESVIDPATAPFAADDVTRYGFACALVGRQPGFSPGPPYVSPGWATAGPDGGPSAALVTIDDGGSVRAVRQDLTPARQTPAFGPSPAYGPPPAVSPSPALSPSGAESAAVPPSFAPPFVPSFVPSSAVPPAFAISSTAVGLTSFESSAGVSMAPTPFPDWADEILDGPAPADPERVHSGAAWSAFVRSADLDEAVLRAAIHAIQEPFDGTEAR